MLTDRRIRSEQYHRDQFIGAFVAAMTLHAADRAAAPAVHQLIEIAAQLIALGQKYHRLQEQQCNGEGYYAPPASLIGRKDRSEPGYVTCPRCEDEVPIGALVGSVRVKETQKRWQGTSCAYALKRRQCVDCRTREQIRQLLPDGWRVRFSGDPRGPVVRVAFAPDARWDWNARNDRWEGADGKPAGPDGRHKLLGAEPRWLVVS